MEISSEVTGAEEASKTRPSPNQTISTDRTIDTLRQIVLTILAQISKVSIRSYRERERRDRERKKEIGILLTRSVLARFSVSRHSTPRELLTHSSGRPTFPSLEKTIRPKLVILSWLVACPHPEEAKRHIVHYEKIKNSVSALISILFSSRM